MNSKRKLGSQQTIWMTTSSTASRSSEMMAAHFIISSSAVAVSDTSATDAWKDMLRLTRSAVREEGGERLTGGRVLAAVGVLVLHEHAHVAFELVDDALHARGLQAQLEEAAPVGDARDQRYASARVMEATVHATGREEVGEGRVVLLDGVVLHDQLVDEGVDLGRRDATP